jgi:hypothetical protein
VFPREPAISFFSPCAARRRQTQSHRLHRYSAYWGVRGHQDGPKLCCGISVERQNDRTGYSEDQIKDNIFRVVQDLDIPAKRDDIKVTNTNHGIEISVTYTVPVDFLVYQTDLNFTPSSEGKDLMK